MTRYSQSSSSLCLSSTENISVRLKDKMLFSVRLDCSWTEVHLTRQGVNELASLSELGAPLYRLIPQSFLPRHNELLSIHCCFIMPSLVDSIFLQALFPLIQTFYAVSSMSQFGYGLICNLPALREVSLLPQPHTSYDRRCASCFRLYNSQSGGVFGHSTSEAQCQRGWVSVE